MRRRTRAELKEDIRTETKVCGCCNKRLPFSSFHVGPTVDGRVSKCMECRRLSIRGYASKINSRSKKEISDDLSTRTKVCGKCKERLPFEMFFKLKSSPDGHQQKCKVCAKEQTKRWLLDNPDKAKAIKLRGVSTERQGHLRRTYSLAAGEYDKLLKDQGGTCKICGGTNGRQPLYVDHSHATGKVRGLLCNKCNTAIGLLQDSADILRSATNYLEMSLETETEEIHNG